MLLKLFLFDLIIANSRRMGYFANKLNIYCGVFFAITVVLLMNWSSSFEGVPHVLPSVSLDRLQTTPRGPQRINADIGNKLMDYSSFDSC